MSLLPGYIYFTKSALDLSEDCSPSVPATAEFSLKGLWKQRRCLQFVVNVFSFSCHFKLTSVKVESCTQWLFNKAQVEQVQPVRGRGSLLWRGWTFQLPWRESVGLHRALLGDAGITRPAQVPEVAQLLQYCCATAVLRVLGPKDSGQHGPAASGTSRGQVGSAQGGAPRCDCSLQWMCLLTVCSIVFISLFPLHS